MFLGFTDVLLFSRVVSKTTGCGWTPVRTNLRTLSLVSPPEPDPTLYPTSQLLFKPLWISTAGNDFSFLFFPFFCWIQLNTKALVYSPHLRIFCEKKSVSQLVATVGVTSVQTSAQKRLTSGSVSAQLVFCHQGVSVKLSYCNLFCSVVEASNSKWLSLKSP